MVQFLCLFTHLMVLGLDFHRPVPKLCQSRPRTRPKLCQSRPRTRPNAQHYVNQDREQDQTHKICQPRPGERRKLCQSRPRTRPKLCQSRPRTRAKAQHYVNQDREQDQNYVNQDSEPCRLKV